MEEGDVFCCLHWLFIGAIMPSISCEYPMAYISTEAINHFSHLVSHYSRILYKQ